MIPKYRNSRQDLDFEKAKKNFMGYNDDEMQYPQKKVKFEENPDFTHVYNAMKMARIEL